MKISITINKYYLQDMNAYNYKNTNKNLENNIISYQRIQGREEEKLNNKDNNITEKGDELRDGLIISASLKKQIQAIHSEKNNEENNMQTSCLVYNCNGVYNT